MLVLIIHKNETIGAQRGKVKRPRSHSGDDKVVGPEFKCRRLAPYSVWSMDQQLVQNLGAG